MPALTATSRTRPSSAKARQRWAEDPEVLLMLRVQRGERAAFSQLVEEYWSRVFGRLYRQLGDRQEAEDLTQDVFLRLYRFRDRYQPRAKFATWLYYITQNVARNAIRSRRRHPCLRLDATALADEELAREPLSPRGTETPSGPMERAEVAAVVRNAMADLGDRQRTALELHQFHDRTYMEIAQLMHMSPKAAKSLLYRARTQLRANLLPLLDVDV